MRRYSFQLGALASAAFALAPSAQPVPKLSSISKDWLQRGATAQVSVAGDNLGGLQEILISGPPGVTAKFVIDRKGAVTSATADSTLPSPEAVACITRAFGKLKFPKPESGVVTVIYPLTFVPAE